MKKLLPIIILAVMAACSSQKPVPDFKIELGKVAKKSVFSGGDSLRYWAGSLVKGEDGLYHMFYWRWPKSIGWEWVTYSEIAHVVSASPFGSYTFKNLALPARGAQYWDGHCTPNPTVHKFNGKYYLYHMRNTGDKKIVSVPGKPKLNWLHRNNQGIGVAVADNPNGPWKRFEKPVLDITHGDSLAHYAAVSSNPLVCQMTDGKILMIYKNRNRHN